MIKIIHGSILCKWANLQNHQTLLYLGVSKIKKIGRTVQHQLKFREGELFLRNCVCGIELHNQLGLLN